MNSKGILAGVPQFCFSEWWNSLKDAERLNIIRNPQSARELIFKAGYAAAQDARIEALEGVNSKLRRCLSPIQMGFAQAECIDEPIPDDAVVISFMGSGASDHVTAGEIRAALGGENGG